MKIYYDKRDPKSNPVPACECAKTKQNKTKKEE
jgi:hypothetical protein